MGANLGEQEASLANYAKRVASRAKVVWTGDLPWRVGHRVLSPLAMPHTVGHVDRVMLRRAMGEAHALMAMWNDAWDTAECPWWWVCCDQADYDVEQLKKKARYDVRTGLKNCQVRRLESEWLAHNGYGVYQAACQRYGSAAPLASAEEFGQEFFSPVQYAGAENWGAFVEDKLVSFACCIVVGDAVVFSWAKSDPQYHKSLPNNALYYELTRHYLVERKCRYVADGGRVMRHQTHVQDFLEKLGYRRIYCPLRIELAPTLRAVLMSGLGTWGRWLGLGKLAPGPLGALDTARQLAKIARTCREILPAHE